MPLDGSHLSDTARRLIAARQQLITDGWCQRYSDFGEQRCAAFAICDSGGDAYAALAAFMAVIGVKNVAALVKWNDAPERTFADVLDAFSRAIAAEMEGDNGN